LTWGGIIPVGGMAFDAINAIWYAAEGDWTNFGWSGLALIPGVGYFSQGVKYGVKAINRLDDASDLIKVAKSAGKQFKVDKIGLQMFAKGAGKKVDILSNKKLTNQTGKVNNYESATKGFDAAKADFNALKPSDVKTYPNGTIVGKLPDGTTINVRPSSSEGYLTVEIYNPTTGTSTKIRY
jgi:hypothetical protein